MAINEDDTFHYVADSSFEAVLPDTQKTGPSTVLG